ncbi:ATP-dependent RNA helicase DDX46-like protein [Dinothrombium tinctorium]|uniref:Probable ATP-dependent RNA helicase DDX46 n=1 Tax=Dinothrombium tinctorium TaxID=1965070 RepID=A0A3S3QV99_9ACAR|nr:ATP-dependent RNA helicase DDX46-like protein [Dinothrombium tinctorium]
MGRWDRDTRDRRRSRSRSPSSPYKRRRSRSPSRRSSKRRSRSRDRSPFSYRRDRDRDRDRDGHRSGRRSRSRERRERSGDHGDNRDRSPKVEDIVGGEVNYENFDKDAQQRKLEILMQQRRERVEKWRAEQAKSKAAEEGKTDTEKSENNDESAENSTNKEGKKKWTLDDEFDEDEEEEEENVVEVDDGRELQMPKKKEDLDESDVGKNSSKEQIKTVIEPKKETVSEVKKEPKEERKEEKSKEKEEEDIDPLDAYMKGIHEEVKKLRGRTVHKEQNEKVTLMVGIAKKKSGQNKGELIEQNQDALEYSSEEDITSAEDLAAMNTTLQNQANKMKKIITVSKEDITYIPFRKEFYIEVPELAKMTPEEVENYREELEGIKVKGKGCPKPLKTWAQSGVSKKVMDLLKRHNYEKPTPIQCQAIPAIMSGRDVIGIAKTGSGKTLAFVLPMLRHILDQPPLEIGDGPIAIIMTPTRELATQIWSECRKFTKSLGLRIVAVYGGTPISEQIGELKPGAEIVVCTPGRMIDMLAANGGRVTNLRRCTYVVLDEADRMFDMGFEPQVMRIIDGTRPDRQTIMFSATFPRIMEALARRILTKPIEIQVGGRSVVCKDVEQHVCVVNEDDKFLKLLEILGRYLDGERSAIVFVDKQENADMLLKELMHASYTCLALHGGIDQTDRDSTIADFKNGKVTVLIATSVAARGLDVKHCVLVINYDCPNHYEDYVHRCGRTGRAGNKGFAWTFITPEQGKYASDLLKAFDLSGLEAPEELKNLYNDYKQRAEAEGKKIKSSSGFSGKGFKFDEAEAQLANEKKKFQKAALGLQDSDDEDAEADIDQEIENMLAPKKSIKQIALPISGQIINPVVTTSSSKLELAKRLASRIAGNLATKATSTTEAFLKGESLGVPSALTARSIAEQRAERLHAKLNYVPKDAEYNEDGELIYPRGDEFDSLGGECFQRYEEELEINDFPQQARWRVTSKEALASISEYSEAGITVRGTYFPPGKDPKEGERKLYLAIEGISERSVSKAKAEIIRLIKEELIKMQNTYQPISKSRYKVI